jgi:DNA-binding NarL/FixJ family response regulator
VTHVVRVLLVVEDQPDVRFLVKTHFEMTDGFEIGGEAASIEEAIVETERSQPDLIVLDHFLEGEMTGLEGAPLLKQAAPGAKIILFTASEAMEEPAANEPAIDAFLLKTDIRELIELSRELLGMASPAP